MFDQAIADGVKNYVQNYFAQQVGRVAAGQLLQLLISNALFVVFRAVLWFLLYCLYELGRDRSFALITLGTVSLIGSILLWMFFSGKAAASFVDEQRPTVTAAVCALLVTAWFWRTYVLAGGNGRRVFDFDIGAALSRLRLR